MNEIQMISVSKTEVVIPGALLNIAFEIYLKIKLKVGISLAIGRI